MGMKKFDAKRGVGKEYKGHDERFDGNSGYLTKW
jgi:hypothetical protein